MDKKPEGAVVINKTNTSPGDRAILLLGFFGGTENQLKKRYHFLAEKYQRDILAIVCPSAYIMSEIRMGNWVNSIMDWFAHNQLLPQVDSIAVLSGGGTVLYYHVDRYLTQLGATAPAIERILWENGPGTITPAEFYRAVVVMMKKQDTFLLRALLYPLFFIACKTMDLFTDYADRVRNLPWTGSPLNRSVKCECCIANSDDPVMYLSYLKKWISKTTECGRDIELKIIQSDRHLNSHKADPAQYMSAWDTFFRAVFTGSDT